MTRSPGAWSALVRRVRGTGDLVVVCGDFDLLPDRAGALPTSSSVGSTTLGRQKFNTSS